MIKMQRWLVSIASLAFGLYHAVLGTIMLADNKDHSLWLAFASLGVYLFVLVPSITMYHQRRLPLAQTILNLAAAVAVPTLMQMQLTQDQKGGYATWYVAAVATLLAATAVRQRRIAAWLGLVILYVEVLSWGGLGFILNSGLIGALLFVAAGTGISIGLESTEKAAEIFTEEAKVTASKSAATSASRLERQTRIQETLRGTLPALRNIVAQNGALAVEQKLEAKLLEAELRDEIAGRDIVDALVRDAAREARRRGVTVTLLDEGGFEGAEAALVEKLRYKVAEVLNQTASGRFVARSPSGEAWRLSIVVAQPGSESPDVFIKLP
jgi:hypothetical protein